MSLRHRFAAWRDLLAHCRAMWCFHWGQRKAAPAPGWLTEQEAAYLPAALALQEKPVSPWSRALAALLIVLIAVALLWSCFGRVDIVVNAAGRVIPSARTKAIAAVEVASVREIRVREGQTVRAGEVLLVLDASVTDAEHDKARDEWALATLTAARAQALIGAVAQGQPARIAALPGVAPARLRAAQLQLDGQYQDVAARLRRLDDDIARLRLLLPLALQREADFERLAREHDVPQHALLEKQQARIETDGQLRDALNQRAALLADVTRQAYDTLNEARRQAAAAAQDTRKAGAHRALLTLLSPVDGTVQQLTVNTVGGVVPAAQTLMLIVPDERDIEVEATVENKDIGFVRAGQRAEVKVDAFNYTRYGTIPARVVQIARDAQQDDKRGLLYSVRIALERGELEVDGRRQALSAGMSVNVEIKTGERRVIEYVLSPLLQHQRESLNER